MRRSPAAMAAVVFCLACSPREAAIPGDEAPRPEPAAVPVSAGTHLELRTSPLVDLYFSVRARAAAVDVGAPAGYEATVEAARALQRSLGSFGGWGPLDSQLFDAGDAGDLLRSFAELPEPLERYGRQLSIRDDAAE